MSLGTTLMLFNVSPEDRVRPSGASKEGMQSGAGWLVNLEMRDPARAAAMHRSEVERLPGATVGRLG